MSESHMSDAKFAKIFFSTIGALFLLTLVLILIARINSSAVSAKLYEERQGRLDQVVADRVEPVGTLNVGEPQQVASTQAASEGGGAGTGAPLGGEAVYQQACLACHGSGVAGAPKLGDQAAWSDRIAKSEETLYDHAINGFQGEAGVMPAKGGATQFSDDEVRNAVDYMLSEVGHETARAASAGGDAEGAATDSTATDGTATGEAASGEAATDAAAPDAAAADAGGDAAAGEAIYQQACVACHSTGVAGSPKLGDAAAWSDRIAKGSETLYDHAINGFQGEAGVMPAKGGQAQLSDDDVRAAVDYMVNAAK